ncbi:hypothetical protein, partial [Escherichia coli]|uniref:hypothetical protein n=1 Tax=Escherichia coli TaxID=562 RepID=UPI001A92E4FB
PHNGRNVFIAPPVRYTCIFNKAHLNPAFNFHRTNRFMGGTPKCAQFELLFLVFIFLELITDRLYFYQNQLQPDIEYSL